MYILCVLEDVHGYHLGARVLRVGTLSTYQYTRGRTRVLDECTCTTYLILESSSGYAFYYKLMYVSMYPMLPVAWYCNIRNIAATGLHATMGLYKPAIQ